MSKRNLKTVAEGVIPMRTKKGTPTMKLADVVMALIDHVAAKDFEHDDGELWNELKALTEEVQRGAR